GQLIENWYIAALSRELKPGKILARTVYSKHFAIFRDAHGKACVLEDRCLHRGTKLSEGHCSERGLHCPYHGWVYDSDGNVISVPSEGPSCDETSLRSRKWKITSPPVIEQDGAIWIWAGAGAAQSETPPWRFPHSGDPKWIRYFMITDFENEVTHLAQ